MSYGQNANRAYFGDLDRFAWRLWETWWNQGGQVKTKGAPEHNSLKKLLIYSSRAWSNISSLTWPPYSCYMTTCSFFYCPKGNLDNNSRLNPSSTTHFLPASFPSYPCACVHGHPKLLQGPPSNPNPKPNNFVPKTLGPAYHVTTQILGDPKFGPNPMSKVLP